MVTGLFFHELFLRHEISPGHPECPDRLIMAMEAIKKLRLIERGQVRIAEPKRADIEDLTAIHCQDYLDEIRYKSEKGGGFFTADTGVNKYSYDAALLAAGGGVMAVDRVLDGEFDNAFLLCRPPGHHAEYDRAFGFCFINNIAVAANHLTRARGLTRVLIVDYDAHHGNGTQDTFYNSRKVMYIGLHQDGRTLFPGTGRIDEIGEGEGRGYNINVPVYPGAGNTSYEKIFSKIIEPVTRAYRPQFILVSAGFDCHHADPLTSMGLTLDGIAHMNIQLRQLAEEQCNGRIVLFLEGGYNLDVVESASQNLIEVLCGSEITKFDDGHEESITSRQYTDQLIEEIQRRLKNIFF